MSGGIDVVFLGTGGSLPTKERGLPSVALRRDGELILLDCGEGTQRQMMHAGLGFNRPTIILISHLHGDHILGLPGLLQTMSSLARDKPLDLYGPKGLMKFLNLIYKPLGYPANFKVRAKELSPGQEVDRGEYLIRTTLAKHDIPCIAYSIEEKERPGRFYPFEGGSENFQTDSRTEGLPDSGVETAQVDFLNHTDSQSNLTTEPVAV